MILQENQTRNSDDSPSTEQIAESLQKAIDRSGIKLNVNVYRKYGEGRSAGFELIDPESEEILFTMDIDVNRPQVMTQIYQISGIHFRGVAPFYFNQISDTVKYQNGLAMSSNRYLNPEEFN